MNNRNKAGRAVILAGGKGRRLAPFTAVLPKPLMPIGDIPILEVVIRQLKYYGYDRITFSVGHLANLIQAFFGDGSKFGITFDYSVEDAPLGTAGPLTLAEGLDESFLVMNGDILTTLDFKAFMEYHRSCNAMVTICIYPRQVKIDFGVIQTDKGLLSDYIEKPTYSFDVSMGIYAFEPEALKYMKKGIYLDIPDLILRLKNAGGKIACYKPDCYWLDIGRLDDYETAVKVFEERKDQFLKE